MGYVGDMKRLLTAFAALVILAPGTLAIDILVFSRTLGFRHESIPAGVACLKDMAARNGWGIDCTEDPGVFSDAGLASFDVAVWLLTTGDVLDAAEQEAFVRFLGSGRGFVGVHSAPVTETDWPWFVGLAGARFLGHPPEQKGKVIVEDRDHPAIPRTMPDEWVRVDEWYSFDRNPRGTVRVLASLDESSYDVDDNRWFRGVRQRMGDHPVVWCHAYGGGRAFQTALGHTAESYTDPVFVAHLDGAIRWAAGAQREQGPRR
jgi:type 1 glutamine amidotransferase